MTTHRTFVCQRVSLSIPALNNKRKLFPVLAYKPQTKDSCVLPSNKEEDAGSCDNDNERYNSPNYNWLYLWWGRHCMRLLLDHCE